MIQEIPERQQFYLSSDAIEIESDNKVSEIGDEPPHQESP
jgi:hypothetical protein